MFPPIILYAYHMSVGEAAIVSVISICIVMLILFLMSAILSIFNVVYGINKRKAAELDNLQAAAAPQPLDNAKEDISGVSSEELVPVETIDDTDEVADEYENARLVAVISAAIAASANTTTDRIVVHSIRRARGWKSTALRENIQ